MSFPNVSDIISTTLENRSGKVADNVSNNNSVLAYIKENGHNKLVDGGRLIYQELAFAENDNGGWYSGYDLLPVSPADVITAAEFSWKQYAVPVVVSGLEEMQNSGSEAVLDLIAERIKVAENTMRNDISVGIFSDGTGTGGKQLTGLAAAVPVTPSTGTYGGINRATASNAFWRSIADDSGAVPAVATIQSLMNTTWSKLVRGGDQPNLIVVSGTTDGTISPWGAFAGSLQALQRFTNADRANLGFPTLDFMGCPAVLDGNCTKDTIFFLNLDYLFFKTHKRRNFTKLSPENRAPFNQDAKATILGWMGNMTCSGAKFQGRLTLNV